MNTSLTGKANNKDVKKLNLRIIIGIQIFFLNAFTLKREGEVV